MVVVILFGVLGRVEKDLGSKAAEGERPRTNGRSALRDGSSRLDWAKNLFKRFQTFRPTLILAPTPDANGDAPICA